MVFSSIPFLLYFLPIVLLVYYAFSFCRPVQNIWLFIASIVFYAWGEPVYVILLLASILVNYILGLFEQSIRDKNDKAAKAGIVVACLVNLGLLFVFKYLTFILTSVNDFAGMELIQVPDIRLPIGISFFTFQALSYVIDIYRKDTDAQKNPLYVGLYIAFFPQLIAGPIVRYKTIAEQIKSRKSTLDLFANGTTRFAVGISKKVLLANNIAIVADTIFRLTQTTKEYYSVPVTMAWLGGICYTLQIYMDFSAYSDMAIGLGQMFGFCFEENFNYPYITKSIGEFWRRWHISLGTWFKEYVYFPLGGSRVKNKDKMVRNTLIVWILTGIWHGAYWTFIFWGIYNLIFIIFERVVSFEKIEGHDFLKHIYSLVVIMFGWIMFRADTLYELGEYFANMFGLTNNAFYNARVGMFLKEYALVIIFSIVFSMPVARICREKLEKMENGALKIGLKSAYVVGLTAAFTFSVISMVKGGYNPFIYFNF
ncbi:acyltransferase MBOAT family [Butyrivibrio proteoclasticus B316]|uniref:Acyltransferase MBOAT family n=1 Tax=Butyrivibrio proteoclasticus (strain ATCC 51982 / DSM 14932 / B316) TaxID=515622 RepID=E0RWF6_BUTPB|nr:acyltransferase MBOAT family [Butyrivibrio proteoclasticus B316]